jgi:hypothetical protein
LEPTADIIAPVFALSRKKIGEMKESANCKKKKLIRTEYFVELIGSSFKSMLKIEDILLPDAWPLDMSNAILSDRSGHLIVRKREHRFSKHVRKMLRRPQLRHQGLVSESKQFDKLS